MDTLVEKKKRSTAKSNGQVAYGRDMYLRWYEQMLLIRRFEESALSGYQTGKIRGFCHVYIGQEAIAAGMESAIRREDGIVTAYRQHGTAIGRGCDVKACMAELYGKATGIVKGKGGSMHFFSAEHNYYGGNGIVGAQIPIGTGIAFAEKYKGTDNLCVTMFGDGAARQGALHESFNMAMAWKLPVLYICENNGYAMGTSVSRTSNVTDMSKLGLSYEMPAERVDGMKPEAVHEAVTRAAEHIRSGKGPFLLEILTYRYKGHSVSDPATYRSKDEVETYRNQDPIKYVEGKLRENGLASDEEIQAIKDRIAAKIAEAVRFADESPYPDGSMLFENNYTQEDYPFITD